MNESPTATIGYCDAYRVKFFSTKKKWVGGKYIAYQFDGRHLSKIKNPSKEKIEKFISWCERNGYIPIDLGGNKSLEYIIDILCQSSYFIGCASGISVAAISVGLPIYVVTHKLPDEYVCFMQKCHYYNKNVKLVRYLECIIGIEHDKVTRGLRS